MTNDEVCACGHHRTDHIYEEGACRPGFRCEDECLKFAPLDTAPDLKGSVHHVDDFLADLLAAEAVASGVRPCTACDAVRAQPEPTRSTLTAALAGTIGTDKLVKILRRHGYTVGRKMIERHRREDHDPRD